MVFLNLSTGNNMVQPIVAFSHVIATVSLLFICFSYLPFFELSFCQCQSLIKVITASPAHKCCLSHPFSHTFTLSLMLAHSLCLPCYFGALEPCFSSWPGNQQQCAKRFALLNKHGAVSRSFILLRNLVEKI